MGIGLIWQNNVWIALQDMGVNAVAIKEDKYDLICCNGKVVLNLIPLHNTYSAQELIELQEAYQHSKTILLHLWEDIWATREGQVLGRIQSVLGLNKRLHGRKGIIKAINQKQADDFLNKNHIQGSAKSKYKFSLDIEGQIVAVACFSNIRLMKRVAADYRSVELIRFATLKGFTVTGGFTRLLKHFIKKIDPNDVMSYADRDWSLGNAYVQSGFTLADVTPPSQIWLKKEEMIRVFPHRLPKPINEQSKQNDENIPAANDNDYMPVFNTGNLKYILYLKSRSQ